MSKDTEVDMKDVELSDMDSEMQPMTGDGASVVIAGVGEKNGTVKVPEEEVKFTGLSKEELMKVAGTPGWVRTRWVLLALFWLGWLGMLAGAVAIIVQAPRCKPIPDMSWWNEGSLYQISDLQAFSKNGKIEGVEKKLDWLNQLKVKGLLLGPLHQVQANQFSTLDLQKIDPTMGSLEELLSLLEKAHKKGISVAASEYWLRQGVDGIKVSDLGSAFSNPDWSSIPSAVQSNETDAPRKKALIGVVNGELVNQVSELLNTSSVNLLLSDLLSINSGGVERAGVVEFLLAQNDPRNVAWTLGASKRNQLSREAPTPELVKLYQLLLFALPGTPYSESPMMLWDIEKEPAEGAVSNETAEADRKQHVDCWKWFKALSELRVKERSLLHGEYHKLHASTSAMAFLRLWDQSERYVAAVNWGSAPFTLTLKSPDNLEMPKEAMVKLSTDPDLAVDSMVSLEELILGPGKGALLQFPFAS
ncbi:hypothetical protein CRUP_009108 [Coryphaenoides rupestris]|nr:hypothetical protein CRUP_009108 [Coryphaenoides rupestris]